jgi:hypothetical protein
VNRYPDLRFLPVRDFQGNEPIVSPTFPELKRGGDRFLWLGNGIDRE